MDTQERVRTSHYIAFKWLQQGLVDPLSGVVWPSPEGQSNGDGWVEMTGSLETWAHTLDGLPPTTDDQLWLVELEGPITYHSGGGGGREAEVRVRGRRGRLLRRVDPWDSQAEAIEFARELDAPPSWVEEDPQLTRRWRMSRILAWMRWETPRDDDPISA